MLELDERKDEEMTDIEKTHYTHTETDEKVEVTIDTVLTRNGEPTGFRGTVVVYGQSTKTFWGEFGMEQQLDIDGHETTVAFYDVIQEHLNR